jgi:hypothetical protein
MNLLHTVPQLDVISRAALLERGFVGTANIYQLTSGEDERIYIPFAARTCNAPQQKLGGLRHRVAASKPPGG